MIAHINVVLQLIDTGPLVRIVNQDDNEDCFHYVRDLWKGKQLYPGRNGKPAENLCVRIRGQTNTRIVVISATDCLIRKRQMRPFFFFFRKSLIFSGSQHPDFKRGISFLWGFAWKNMIRDSSGEKRVLGELVDIQGWPPQTQAWSVLASRKSNRGGKRPAWITRSSWLD